MKIDYAIVSSDNSHYLDFWPLIEKAWRRIGIEPVLIKITDRHYQEGNVIELPQIEGIKPSLLAQISRIWIYKILKGNILISDIDMLPMSKDYFQECASPFTENHIIIYGADSLEKFGTYPMCYILGNNETMSTLIPAKTWEEFVKELADAGGQGWSTDQWYITKILTDYKDTVKLNRGWNSAGVADKRIDRINWRYGDLQVNTFIDAHLLRPYSEHKHEIEILWNLLN